MNEKIKLNPSSSEDNKSFLGCFGFKDTGCYYKYHNGELEFCSENKKLTDKQAGICLDGQIVHIGTNQNIFGVL